jgi:hypothetical protein
MSARHDAVRPNQHFHVVDHAMLCSEALGEFHCLVDAIVLTWTRSVDEYIVASDRPGSGYQLTRVASEQNGRWRQRLTADNTRAAARVLMQLPISEPYAIDDAGWQRNT